MARLFFALQPPAGERQTLASLVPQRIAKLARGPVRADNLHLTVCFLGETPDSAIPTLLALAGLHREAGFRLVLDRLDYWSRPRVFCALPREDVDLQRVFALSRALHQSVREAGFTPDERPFRPHVTLLRGIPARLLAGEAWPHSLTEAAGWNCESLQLMRSDPGPDGPVYRIVRD